jgi:peptidoglycan/xylan/chitin deacetylase (PgdA/CDA1 family)
MAGAAMNGGRAIVFIDVEAGLEGPWREWTDPRATAGRIGEELLRHRVPAVFNVCGALLAVHGALFRGLEQAGHEIALHGWRHENLRMMDDGELGETLRRCHGVYGDTLGHPAAGFRAPWLEHDRRLTQWLSHNGYRWTSHRHQPFRERFLTPALRPELRRSRSLGAWWSAMQELGFGGAPRRVAGALRDIPLTSSMDGELLGLLSPRQQSPPDVLDHCQRAWLSQARRHRSCFTLNVHDWLTGTANRPELLSRSIAGLRSLGFAFTTAARFIQDADAVAG